MENFLKNCMILTFSRVKCDTISTLKNSLIYLFSYFSHKFSFHIDLNSIYKVIYELKYDLQFSFFCVCVCFMFSAKMPIFVHLMKLVMSLTDEYFFFKSITYFFFLSYFNQLLYVLTTYKEKINSMIGNFFDK